MSLQESTVALRDLEEVPFGYGNAVGHGCIPHSEGVMDKENPKATGRAIHDELVFDLEATQKRDADPEIAAAAERLRTRYAYRIFRRVMDIAFSAIVLVLLSWLLAIIAITIKIDDPKGPVIFSQERVGRNGKFKMFKFRSMCNDAEVQLASLKELNEKTGPVFKIKNDPRVDSRIIETNTRRPLSALVFASVFPPKNTVVSAIFSQVNAQIMHPAETAGKFFAAKWRKTAQSSQKLAKRIFALLEGLNNRVRIPSGAAGFMQPATA